ncbi:MAG: hypothetical protein ACYDB2_07540 [Acidimicrobiales bacterium]
MTYVHYSASSPSGRRAQLQAIALITAALDSPDLLQQEVTNSIGPKPDAEEWVLLTIALCWTGAQLAALVASQDSENADVIFGDRPQFTSAEIIQKLALVINSDDV